MKGSTLLLISAVALVHADPTRYFENGCPKDRSKLLPHQDCGRFFVCFGETKFVRECPPGLHFNSKLELCDFPKNAKCKSIAHQDSKVELRKRENKNEINVPDVVIEVDKSDPSRAPVICATENSDGVLVAHENCNQFYKCYDGEPVALDCPDNLLYNIEKEYCDWPSNVICGQRVIPEGNDVGDNNDQGECDDNADPSEAAKICAADDSDGVLVPHENCNQFYKCFNRKPVALNCPKNLLYNIEEEYCDWPSNVICGERVIPEGNDVEDNNGGNGGDNNSNDDEGPCAGNNADPSEAPKICAADDSDGVLVAHENCNQFYKCFAGEPVALDCPSNLLFNPEKDYCDWRFNVNCGDRIIPENSDENDDNLANQLCTGKDDDIVFAHENCNQFYKCVDTHMEPMYCPEGLYFNTKLKVCDWPTSVDCGQRLK